jgi:hypothetical protein
MYNDNCIPIRPFRIAFIGSVGIPNCYGGFEAFLESVAPVMVKQGHFVVVTCDRDRYSSLSGTFLGVKRVFVGINANGILSPLHDLAAFLKVVGTVDTVVVLGVSAGPFFAIMRLICALLGKRLVINIDGIEWRRTKFSLASRLVLRAFDAFAQIFAHRVVYDNAALLDYVLPIFRHKAKLIPYAGDQVIRLPGLTPQFGTALTICRIEPENSIEALICGALASNLNSYTIIGNWKNSKYGADLRKKYSHTLRLILLDPIYDPEIVAKHRESCHVYLHGHSVGGTNPSLVEMLFYDCELICFNCNFNIETARADAVYFKDSDELVYHINECLLAKSKRQRTQKHRYMAVTIARDYYLAAT